MKSHIALLSSVIYLLAACSQQSRAPITVNTEVDSVWAFHSKTLFEDLVEGFELDYRPVFVSTKPHGEPPSGCYDAIFESLSALNVNERDTLAWEKELTRVVQWDSLFFGAKFKLVPEDTIRGIFADRDRWWGYFNDYFGPGFSTFSTPIFFSNYRYALIYASEHCGGLCGYGAWFVMKREDGHWVKVDEHCFWIS